MKTNIPHYCIVVAAVNQDGLFPDKTPTLFHYTLNYLKNVGVKKEDILVLGDDVSCIAYASSLGLACAQVESKDIIKKCIESASQRLKESGSPFSLVLLQLDNPAREHDLLEQVIITSKAKPERDIEVAHKNLYSDGEHADWRGRTSVSMYAVWYTPDLDEYYKTQDEIIGFPAPAYYVFQNTFCGASYVQSEYHFNKTVTDAIVEEAYKMSIVTALGDEKYPRVVLIDTAEKSN